MPKVIEDFLEKRQLIEIDRHKSAQWKYFEICSAGKQDDEQNCEQEHGNGVSHDDHRAGPHIKAAAMANALLIPSGIETK